MFTVHPTIQQYTVLDTSCTVKQKIRNETIFQVNKPSSDAYRLACSLLKSRCSQRVSLPDVSLVPADPMLSGCYGRLGTTEWMRHINHVTNRHSAPHFYFTLLSASQTLRHCDRPHTQEPKCVNKSTAECILSYSQEFSFICRGRTCHVISCVIY
jgi:hypothetical protein